jgi:hypothetical protein
VARGVRALEQVDRPFADLAGVVPRLLAWQQLVKRCGRSPLRGTHR